MPEDLQGLYAHPALSIATSYLGCALVVLSMGWLALPTASRRNFKPNRSTSRFILDQLLRLAVVAYAFAFFFAISWRPLYSFVATVSLFVIFSGVCRAKFAFIREPLLFSDLALVLDLFKYKEMFYASWLNLFFWIAAGAYVFGASALFMLLEPSLLPDGHVLAAYVSGLAAWLAPALLLSWRPWRARVSAFLQRAVEPQNPQADTLRLGSFEYVLLGFLMWLGATRPLFARSPDHGFQSVADAKAAPLVVVWQSESFIDMRRFGVENLALPNFDALGKQAVRRGLLGNVFEGGYTLRTEFSVLSGIDPDRIGLDASHPYLSAEHYGKVAWPGRLRAAGWRTHFVHPYDRTFFMRHRAIPQLGFERMSMLDDFHHVATANSPYVSDHALSEQVGRICREEDPATPLFLFAASMGNHGPWSVGRAGNLTDPVEIYCSLLEEADSALGMLAGELGALKRPVWLVFYGDHAPLLKSFADPFPDPRTDYFIAPLGDAGISSRDGNTIDVEPWELIETVAALVRASEPREAKQEPAESARRVRRR